MTERPNTAPATETADDLVIARAFRWSLVVIVVIALIAGAVILLTRGKDEPTVGHRPLRPCGWSRGARSVWSSRQDLASLVPSCFASAMPGQSSIRCLF